MKGKAGKTTNTQCHLSAKENQEDCWYCCRYCCQCEERLACHHHIISYHLCLWGCPMGQSSTFSKKTKGWSPQPTSFRCGWPPTRSCCFGNPTIGWFWLLRPFSSSGVWRGCWLVISWLWRASRRSGKGSDKTSALASPPLPSGCSWTAATSASGSTMDKPRNLQK